GSAWGSAPGARSAWEPADHGLRRAAVGQAEAPVPQAPAGEALTRLDVQSAVGAAFLGVVAAQRAVAAAQADLDRRDILSRAVHTLVDNQLRPGAEASRADAERAAAQTRLLQAQQTLTIAQTTLTRVLGITTGGTAIAGDPLLARLPPADLRPAGANVHPLALVRQAGVDQAR